MISAETSALVAGGNRAPAAPAKPVMVRVLRAFMADGQRVEVGAEVPVAAAFAAELVAAGKAERAPERAAPAKAEREDKRKAGHA